MRCATPRGGRGDERERLYRLRKACEGGVIAAQLAEQIDALENAELASRVEFRGEELPLRAAQAQLAVLERLPRPRRARGSRPTCRLG